MTDMEVPGSVKPQAAWIALAAVAAIGFVIVGLSAWRVAPRVVAMLGAPSPRLATWAVRCGSVAIIAAAQLVLVGFVADGIYRRDRFSTALRVLAGVVLILAAVSAVVLVVAGKFVRTGTDYGL